ncbi:hypothetical protein [Vibrio sp. St2]|uniref:hypothetical protein n=1 Tax=Vibrio sp. St2 TaxID=2853441 RepID=UPI00248EB165|nr:hypothetical protein [Vibrio sp. St2]
MENDIKYEVYKPEEPMILKSGESVGIALPPYSNLEVDGDRFVPQFFFGKIEFYANLGNKIIKCLDEKITDAQTSHRIATKFSNSFDGHLYNELVRFILVYYSNGQKQLAFFDTHGFIGNEWKMSPNHLGKNDYCASDIEKMLEHYGYSQLFSNYICFEKHDSDGQFRIAFQKIEANENQ